MYIFVLFFHVQNTYVRTYFIEKRTYLIQDVFAKFILAFFTFLVPLFIGL